MADPVDAHVGSRVRLRRTLLGLSQTALAEQLGLTFQQLQKYEKGHNRISCGRLYKLSQVLDVPVSFFFDDMPAGTGAGKIDAMATGNGPVDPDQMSRRETLELVRAYYRIENPRLKRAVYEFTKAAASQLGRPPAE